MVKPAVHNSETALSYVMPRTYGTVARPVATDKVMMSVAAAWVPSAGLTLTTESAFAVPGRGKSYLVCAGDTVRDPGNPVLGYGEAVSFGGISCVSAKTGITCTNAAGHGFSVAKAKQKLF